MTSSGAVVLRPERPGDAKAIGDVNRRAFDGEVEPRLVEAIRASDGFLPDLSLVAESDAGIVGHVMLSRVWLEDDGGARREVLCLAPLAVAPERQREGVGAALMRRAVNDADERGWPLIVLLGHPSYYPRFGFAPASRVAIRAPFHARDDVFMALPLSAYTAAHRGTVRFPPAFDVTAERSDGAGPDRPGG